MRDDESIRSVVELASADTSAQDLRRAKDRLRAVLRHSPHFQPALELMGEIYFQHGDYRNAVMYWSQAGRWDDSMRQACDRVFAVTGRALMREHAKGARYQLYAFAGGLPPADLAERLAVYQRAYFKLDEKKSRFKGLSCVPVAGGVLLAALAMVSMLLGGGWASLAWIGVFSFSATTIVLGINACLYYRASRLFDKALEQFRGE